MACCTELYRRVIVNYFIFPGKKKLFFAYLVCCGLCDTQFAYLVSIWCNYCPWCLCKERIWAVWGESVRKHGWKSNLESHDWFSHARFVERRSYPPGEVNQATWQTEEVGYIIMEGGVSGMESIWAPADTLGFTSQSGKSISPVESAVSVPNSGSLLHKLFSFLNHGFFLFFFNGTIDRKRMKHTSVCMNWN